MVAVSKIARSFGHNGPSGWCEPRPDGLRISNELGSNSPNDCHFAAPPQASGAERDVIARGRPFDVERGSDATDDTVRLAAWRWGFGAT